ncbi:MAG: phosphatidylserine decarboxylase [Vicinamibacterales bacterium]|nr:phosphatidylserine decarboxylase [Vicinamibacterales bacterium]
MLIDRAGWPFVLVALGLALVAGWWLGRAGAVPLVVLAAFFLFFFRDPGRTVPADAGLVVSPADGRVMLAGAADPGAPPGEWQQITIFLSPVDVHVNRTPVAGRVTRVDYHPGKFLPAYRRESGAINERTEIELDHDGIPIVFRQVVGVLARRIVCRIAPGDTVTRGQKFGVMKFGSRMDVFLPLTATLRVTTGDRVVGGETILAVLESR